MHIKIFTAGWLSFGLDIKTDDQDNGTNNNRNRGQADQRAYQLGVDGAALVELSTEIRTVDIPLTTLTTLENRSLELRSDGVILDIPNVLIKQYMDQLSSEERVGGKLRFNLVPLEASEANGYLEQSRKIENSSIKLNMLEESLRTVI